MSKAVTILDTKPISDLNGFIEYRYYLEQFNYVKDLQREIIRLGGDPCRLGLGN